ncbi:aldose 1-epimerase family protein [Nibribacter ruber]|uniref:Aldose 1-epimerase family protein n=1 Tax=Nibribacter ruber TaxID=2698458 RepID=A0A6P1P338_9BACT|nr:aldose 1-epimerase family protein [Nibribacter ruber]QHL88809.1 aldose 1-epimerase family protein [Nibribacter ruber]
MAIAYLENDLVRIGVKSHGAELCSFIKKSDQREYIWQAHPEFWNRHAPVLFPIVGRLPKDQYLHQGQTYSLPQHGFARDLEFALISQEAAHLVYELKANDATRSVYPFEFSLQISYTLENQTLQVGYRVQHLGEGEMLFSIGAHPAFHCPMTPNTAFEDYYLEFSQPETLARYLLQDGTGLQNGQTEPVLDNMAVLPLRYQQYEKDALVFKNVRSEKLTLKCDQHPYFVQMQYEGFPYLGIWTKSAGAPFLCIEPWHGIAGTAGPPVELSEKEGMLSLGTQQVFEASYTIAIG